MDQLPWLASVLLLAAVCGALGALLLVRGQGMVLSALGHATLPGLGIALLITGGAMPDRGLLVMSAAGTGLMAAGLVAWLSRRPGVRPDAAQAVTLGLAFGLGAVLWSIQEQTAAGQGSAGFHWQPWLFGQVAALAPADVAWLLTVCAIALLYLLCAFRQLQLAAFDPDQARLQGLPVALLDTLLLLLTALVAVLAMKAVGLVLVLGLFLAPAALGRAVSVRLGPACVTAALAGMAATLVGISLSLNVPWVPAGPAIVLAATLGLCVGAPLHRAWPRRGGGPEGSG